MSDPSCFVKVKHETHQRETSRSHPTSIQCHVLDSSRNPTEIDGLKSTEFSTHSPPPQSDKNLEKKRKKEEKREKKKRKKVKSNDEEFTCWDFE